jgi:pimeloyl-ACP methyl ester carboxylesterase
MKDFNLTRRAALALGGVAAYQFAGSVGWGQAKPQPMSSKRPPMPAKGAAKTPKATKTDDEGPPPPESITRETKDGVALHFTYYAGTLGKKAVPVIMLHGWDGQGSDYEEFALRLQAAGHAVVTPDLRGFGRSKSVQTPSGDVRELDPETFRAKAIESMTYDVETVRKFLLEKNNEGELNIEALCVIAAEFSTIVALNWSRYNWEQPVLPAYKLGQDVKAIVLLSPVASFKGTTSREALNHQVIKSRLSTLIAAGNEDPKVFGEAKRLHSSLQAFHPKVSNDPAEQKTKLDLFFVTPETKLQGTQLLDDGLPVANNILGFINLRLVAKMNDLEWQDRKNPL